MKLIILSTVVPCAFVGFDTVLSNAASALRNQCNNGPTRAYSSRITWIHMHEEAGPASGRCRDQQDKPAPTTKEEAVS